MSVDPPSADALARNPIAPDLLETLVGGLSAYGRLYGLPSSPEQVQGILGTLMRLHLPEQPAAVVDQVTQQVLDGLTPEALKNVIVSRASSTLAKETHRWQAALEQQVTGTLTAYVKRYGVDLTPENLLTMATAVMPLLDDRPVTRAEALGLVSQVAQTFAVDDAIAAVIPPHYMAIAQTLATALSQKPLEDAVGETVTAYVQKFSPGLVTVGEDLISNALSAVLKNQVDFGIDVDLNLADRQLLIQQISFKLNILQQSPPPSKTAEAIAAEVDAAVSTYRNDRPSPVDVSEGVARPGGVSSPFTSTRRPADGSNAADDFWQTHSS